MTVAMIYAEHGVIPPKEWEHDPLLTDSEGWTVAMLIADCCERIPPKEW